MDRLELGPVPYEESCQQVGTKDYDSVMARAECAAFRNQIRRVCGDEPEGAKIVIKRNPHDFGSYYEVAVSYDETLKDAIDYAFRVESTDIPNWDEIARKELGIKVPEPDFAHVTAYVEWGGMYDIRKLELIIWQGHYSYEDRTGGHVSLTQDSEYATLAEATAALIKVVFTLGESRTYLDFGTGGIVKK